ncbi:MAG: leucyl aminopeptidase [Rubellimicrobium sp.]|nr:leucyl aminopeptidase [Rubellimicrobium sp.]
MTEPLAIRFHDMDLADLPAREGRIGLVVPPDGRAGAAGRLIGPGARRALARLVAGETWEKAEAGDGFEIAFPAGLAAEALVVVKLPGKATVAEARKAGAALARLRGKGDLTVLAGAAARPEDIAFGLALRAYDFDTHRTDTRDAAGGVAFHVTRPEDAARAAAPLAALAEGVFFTRDLVNEPANILTTTDFAARLGAMQELGLDVEILEPDEIERLGMRLLLSVAQGSASPARVVVMRWQGGGDEAPVALVGKGVVFDTGGISIKPAAGMDAMTMDMGGAAVVAGVMRTLALRRARANVVGVVGIVENMPSGHATRPGDVVRSMKGDTVENVNTDAEGRLVLADALWLAQERFAPRAMVNLATLTGAMMVALGGEFAGVFANDDALWSGIEAAARAEDEGAWRMPLGKGYAEGLKSRIADVKNVGGREGGACVAAEFLRRFVKDGTPWAHMDIAGVTLAGADRVLSPKGATGWGVMLLNRLIADRYEAG